MKRLSCLLVFVLLSLYASFGIAQIQIRPLPDQKPAQVLPLGGHELSAADTGTWLDSLFQPALEHRGITSAVVVVVKDGQILLSRGYGDADTATGKPVDPATTLFRPGSIAKTFTWTAVMQLVEQGKLDLDADVNRYLDFSIPAYAGQPVTLRELMTHTAGFDNVEKDLFVRDAATAADGKWFESWLKRSLPPRVYPPGVVSSYSNYGAALAGYIVQRVSGQPFADYVEQHIFLPLGMQHASFREPLPPSLQGDLAASYAPGQTAARPFEIRSAMPAGGLSISGEDMARFMIAHLQDGRYGGAQILQPQTAQQMHDFRHDSVPGLLPIALGFLHMDRNGRSIIGHGGDLPFFHSAMALYLQDHVGVFVSIDGRMGVWLRQRLLVGFADRYFPALPQQPLPTLASAREHGALLAGSYLSSRASRANFLSAWNLLGQTRIFMLADGSLITPGFRDATGKPRRWREVQPFLWLDDAGGSHLGALVQHGVLRWISIDEMSPAGVFLPVPAWQSVAWNLPLLGAALLVLLLVALAWPANVLWRRSRGLPPSLPLPAAARRWQRCSWIVAILYLLLAAGWVYLLREAPGAALDTRLRLLQLIGVLAVLGTVPVLMNAICACRGQGDGWRRCGSVALLLACLAGLWFIFSLHLLTLSPNY